MQLITIVHPISYVFLLQKQNVNFEIDYYYAMKILSMHRSTMNMRTMRDDFNLLKSKHQAFKHIFEINKTC